MPTNYEGWCLTAVFHRWQVRLVMYLEVHCVFSSRATEDCWSFCKRSCTDHTWTAFLQCACACVFYWLGAWIVALITLEQPFSQMGPDMLFEITSLCTGVATLRADERLFSWTNQHVFLDTTSLCAGIAALQAIETNPRMCILRAPARVREYLHCEQLKSFFSWMTQHVSFEIRSLCEGISALFALVRFFSRVNPHVALEFKSSCSGKIALCASKRLLITMNQHMSIQIARPIAYVVALVATVWLLSIIQTLLGMFSKYFHVYFFSQSVIMKGWRITDAKMQTKKL